MANRDEDAPWLAEAAPLHTPARQRPLLNIVIAVLALAAVAAVALLMLLGRKDSGSTQGYMEAAQAPLIEAEPGPYKVPPADREGLAVEGDGEVIHETVRGHDPDSVIDMTALPEEPLGRPRDLLPATGASSPAPATTPAPPSQPVPVQIVPQVAASAAPAPRPAAPVVAPKPPAPQNATKPALAATKPALAATTPPPPPAKPATVQLQIGAFSSEAKAEEEWSRVAGKGGLTAKQIQKLTNSAGKTLWRVRGQARDGDAACKAILAARGACELVKP